MPGRRPTDPFATDCGRLAPVRRVAPRHADGQWWEFRCACGNSHVAKLAYVKAGRVKSCGCYRTEVNRANGLLSGDRRRTGRAIDPAKAKAARLAAGLSLTALARSAGMGRRCVTYYERDGAKPPPPATLAKLAAALGVPPESITA